MSYGSREWQKWVLEEDEALPLLEHTFKAGINTCDTSDMCSNGRSEEIIGKAISTYNIPRDELILMTKCRWGTSRIDEPQLSMYAATVNDGRMVNRVGLSRSTFLILSKRVYSVWGHSSMFFRSIEWIQMSPMRRL